MYARHPEMAERWEEHTPPGKRLPEHVKDAGAAGVGDALARFGLKHAGEELRLKIPDRVFHGFDAAAKAEASRGHVKKADAIAGYGDRRSSEDLVDMLRTLDISFGLDQPSGSKDPLERSTNWGPPSSQAAGDVGGRAGLGQSTGFGGI